MYTLGATVESGSESGFESGSRVYSVWVPLAMAARGLFAGVALVTGAGGSGFSLSLSLCACVAWM